MSGQSASRLNCEIKDYSVLSIFAAVGLNLGEEPATETTTDMRVIKDGSGFDVYLRCRRKEGGFEFDCAVKGSFVFYEPITENNARCAWVNGCTILYGVIRNLYMTMSAQCLHKPLILPAMMMIDVVNKRIVELQTPTKASKARTRKPRA